MSPEILNAIHYSSLSGGFLSSLYPALQFFNKEIPFSTASIKILIPAFLGIASSVGWQLGEQHLGLPYINPTDIGLLTFSIASLFGEDREPVEKFMTGFGLIGGAITGYYYGKEINHFIIKILKNGISFYRDAINIIKNMKWPDLSPVKDLVK